MFYYKCSLHRLVVFLLFGDDFVAYGILRGFFGGGGLKTEKLGGVIPKQ